MRQDEIRTSCLFLTEVVIKNHLLWNKIQGIENKKSFPSLVAWMKISNNLASDGNRVNVGNFDSNGLNVNNYWDDNRNNNLGLASSRNSFSHQRNTLFTESVLSVLFILIYMIKYKEIISLGNLFLAWNEFKKGKMNKADVQSFSRFLVCNIFNLYYQLVNKTYRHSNYISFYINDPKLRHIHKACVKDRVLHHAVFRILYPIFDKSFIFDSYSCRLNKGTHRAVNRLSNFARKASKNNTKKIYILKLDIRKFFNSVNHNILLFLVKKKVKDNNIIWLVEKIVKSFSMGLPLGNITSQLFANIYLNELDYFIKHGLRIKYYIRYCDDFVIISSNKMYLKSIVPLISNFLKTKLKLELHPNKIIIKKHNQGIDFLGYISFPHCRILRTKTKDRMFKKINQRKEKLRYNLISEESFNQTVQSYLGILKHCNGWKIERKIRDLTFLKA